METDFTLTGYRVVCAIVALISFLFLLMFPLPTMASHGLIIIVALTAFMFIFDYTWNVKQDEDIENE